MEVRGGGGGGEGGRDSWRLDTSMDYHVRTTTSKVACQKTFQSFFYIKFSGKTRRKNGKLDVL